MMVERRNRAAAGALALLASAGSAIAQVEIGMNYSWWRFDPQKLAECQTRPGMVWQGDWIIDQYHRPDVRETVQRNCIRCALLALPDCARSSRIADRLETSLRVHFCQKLATFHRGTPTTYENSSLIYQQLVTQGSKSFTGSWTVMRFFVSNRNSVTVLTAPELRRTGGSSRR